MNQKRTYILGGALVVVMVVGVLSHNRYNPICPDDFATGEEQTAAMVAWENHYFDENPDGTLSTMAEARHQFYIDNHCTASLQRYEDAKNGKADPATMERINKIIQTATQ